MRALLIAPYLENTYQEREDFLPSSALVYLASFLRERGHEPILLDLNTQVVNKQADKTGYCRDKIIENIQKESPQLIGFNCLFSVVFPSILEFVKVIKSNFPGTKIVVGGIHPTTYFKDILENCEEIDYVVLGEGEIQLAELADCMEQDDFTGLHKIGSFAYREEEGEVKFNRRISYLNDLNELPMPAWDLVDFENYQMDLSHYYNPKRHEIKYIAPIFSSRGCPYDCNFCDMFLVMGRKHRRRSVEHIVNEIYYLNHSYEINYFSFMDDNLTLQKEHILKICSEIKRRKLDIQFDTPNGVCINTLDEEIIAAMAGAGLISTSIAIEHGSDYIRNEIVGKRLKREKIFEVAELLKKYQVMTGGFFIMGFPEETNETLEDTYKMMNELKLDRTGVSILMPFPGTKLFEQAKRDNLFVDYIDLNNLWKTPLSHAQSDFVIKPYGMSIEQLEQWRAKFDELRYKYIDVNARVKRKKRLSYR